jgi:hypothetical protein
MDAKTQLALMSKAKFVFGSPNTFLSFPVTPLPFTPRELDFFTGIAPGTVATADTGAEASQSYRNLQAFSTLVNLLPSGETWAPAEMRFLWDAYGQVFRDATLATSSRTAEEEATYQRAKNLLRGPDGTARDSVTLIAYKRCKDAYRIAEQAYKAAQSTAEAGTSDERQRWQQSDEPALRAQLDALMSDWVITGRKHEIEAAESLVLTLGAKSPSNTWQEWRARFNPDLDRQHDASQNSDVYPTFFSPSNAVEPASFRPFTLTPSEVDALVSQAPAELRARFGVDGSAAPGGLRFEFSSAVLARSWFSVDALRARFWRFNEGTEPLSRGEWPPRGSWPAYVTAVVFARRVVEQRAPQQQLSLTAALKFAGFSFVAAAPATQPAGARPASTAAVSLAAKPAPKLATLAEPGTVVVSAKPMRAAMAREDVERPRTYQKPRPKLVDTTKPDLITRGPTPPPSPQPTPQPPAPPDDTIYILAFICKPLPLCPDPDLALPW